MSAAGAGTGSFVPMQTAGVGMVPGTLLAANKYFPPKYAGVPVPSSEWNKNPVGQGNYWGQGYTGPAGGFFGSMGQTGGIQDQPVMQSTVNSMARTQTFMCSENSARINELSKWAEGNGFNSKRKSTSFEGVSENFNNVEAHQTSNYITDSTPYEIKTIEGKRAYDEYMARPKGVLSLAQVEGAAIAIAKITDEDVQEKSKKKSKLAAHAPATPTRDDCIKIFKAMTAHQTAINAGSAETLKLAKDFTLIGRNAKKLRAEHVTAYTDNAKIFGLLYFFSQTGLNPFTPASDEDKNKFRLFKQTYDLGLEEDWDGSEADCSFPDA